MKSIAKLALLASAVLVSVTSPAQQRKWHGMQMQSADVALTFSFERAQQAAAGSSGFWLKGGSADASITLWRGLGVAANLTGEHAANIQGNVSLGKFAYMAGPRYSMNTSRYTGKLLRKHASSIFGETLFGVAHVFDGLFPATGGTTSTANSFQLQAGGGINLQLQHGFGIRPLEMDYVHSTLPNNAANSQNDLRLAFGVTYHIGK